MGEENNLQDGTTFNFQSFRVQSSISLGVHAPQKEEHALESRVKNGHKEAVLPVVSMWEMGNWGTT